MQIKALKESIFKAKRTLARLQSMKEGYEDSWDADHISTYDDSKDNGYVDDYYRDEDDSSDVASEAEGLPIISNTGNFGPSLKKGIDRAIKLGHIHSVCKLNPGEDNATTDVEVFIDMDLPEVARDCNMSEEELKDALDYDDSYCSGEQDDILSDWDGYSLDDQLIDENEMIEFFDNYFFDYADDEKPYSYVNINAPSTDDPENEWN